MIVVVVQDDPFLSWRLIINEAVQMIGAANADLVAR